MAFARPSPFAFAALMAACALLPLTTALAQEGGTLAKVKASGAITFGYRESSFGFSYLDANLKPVGYSIDICNRIVDAIKTELRMPSLEVRYQAVTSANRIPLVANGTVDIECGSTTNLVERQKQVAFSPIVFVAGTRLLVKRGSPIRSYRDLAGRTVAVTAGTTNEKAMQEIARRFKLDFRILEQKDHSESYARLAEGKADAFATDDVLLFGLIAQNKAQKQYQVVGEFLSYDPYGIMFRKGDAQLAELVKRAFHDLAEDGEIERQYKRWFLQRLPSGQSLDLPMSPQLETLVRAMAARPE